MPMVFIVGGVGKQTSWDGGQETVDTSVTQHQITKKLFMPERPLFKDTVPCASGFQPVTFGDPISGARRVIAK